MNVRAAVLPTLAAGLVAAVLGVQVAHGGGDFAPPRGADPCAERTVEPVSGGIEGLGEQLVLLGLDAAACRLGVTREALVVRLAQEGERTDEEVDAVRGGLKDAVDRLDREGRLPKVSELADEALGEADLPGFVKRAIGAVPDGVLDGRLPTDELLRKAVDDLDVKAMLGELDDPAQVQARIVSAITDAAVKVFLDGLPNPFS